MLIVGVIVIVGIVIYYKKHKKGAGGLTVVNSAVEGNDNGDTRSEISASSSTSSGTELRQIIKRRG